MPTARSTRPGDVVDTPALVAGISGFRSGAVASSNPSEQLLRDWLERGTFAWIVSENTLSQYKAVLRRLKVQRENHCPHHAQTQPPQFAVFPARDDHFFHNSASRNSGMKSPPTTERAWKPTCLPSVVSYQSVSGTCVGVSFIQR